MVKVLRKNTLIVLGLLVLLCVGFVGCSPAEDNTQASVIQTSDPKVDEEKVVESKNSRSNPLEMNQSVEIVSDSMDAGKVKIRLTLTEIIRGDEADKIVKEANQFNDLAEEGNAYMLAKFKIELLKTQFEESIKMNDSVFSIVSKDGTVYNKMVMVAGVTPDINTELYEGASHEGYIPFEIKKDDEPLIRFSSDYETHYWFDIK